MVEGLIEALSTIKCECLTHQIGGCEECPLSKGEDCLLIDGDPSQWNILEEPIKKVIL